MLVPNERRMLLIAVTHLALFLVSAIPFHHPSHSVTWRYRGGESTEELTLEEKVQAAMQRLGIQPVAPASSEGEEFKKPPVSERTEAVSSSSSEPPPTTASASATTTTPSSLDQPMDQNEDTAPLAPAPTTSNDDVGSCTIDGVCTAVPPPELTTNGDPTPDEPHVKEAPEDPEALAQRIATSMNVDISLVWAALAATADTTSTDDGSADGTLNETKARALLQLELDMVHQIPADAPEVQLLQAEGHDDTFLIRRALAFAERNVEDARAILQAELDEEEEQADETVENPGFKTVSVDAGFDPTALGGPTPNTPPAPAPRDSVVFEATTAQVFPLVLQSPVPVLLDIYADWCGPCKALSPILEDMAIKSGGAFRLVKVNTDQEQAVSSALDVTSLPTVFGVRDGRIVHMFQGMPRSEEKMKNFMMGLLGVEPFAPPISDSELEQYDQWTRRLIQTTAAAGYSFGARERLQDRTMTNLDTLVQQAGGVVPAEAAAQIVRSLLHNIVKDPFATKFRTIKLDNKVIKAKVAPYPAALAILKSVGFGALGSNAMVLQNAKVVVNPAPLMAARDAIDKWIDKKRYEVAKESRKQKDEADKAQVQVELAQAREAKKQAEIIAEQEAQAARDPNVCKLKLRVEGKKKVHTVELDGDAPLRTILSQVPGLPDDDTELQITCVAKRLVFKSSDEEALQKTLREHNLFPTASLVIKPLVATTPSESATESSTLTARAAARRKLKRGSHTMQSVGIYAKNDNAKGELIDGGGGALYEHDVSDDEDEGVDGTSSSGGDGSSMSATTKDDNDASTELQEEEQD